ncbi:MAG: DsrE family protein [Anaerolineaceae bacterium]|nr:DsrE family protein [Anaerolineaceae bacterium]
MTEKLLIIVTHGPDEPELATIPFVMATTSQALEVEVVMGFQADGVLLVKKGIAELVEASAFPPLKTLLEAYVEAGGQMLACAPCLKSRGIIPETDLINGVKVVNAASLVKECTLATHVLTY